MKIAPCARGLAIVLLAATSLSVTPVNAARTLTTDQYVELTAELTFAAWGCGVEVDMRLYHALFPPPDQLDARMRDEINNRVDAKMAEMEPRLKAKGEAAFCAEMLAKYGPRGNKHRGLMKKIEKSK